MRVAIDTNVLVYAQGIHTDLRRDAAVELLGQLPHESPVIPVQVLGELFNVLVRKGRWSREEAGAAIRSHIRSFPLIDTTPSVLLEAAGLSARHGLSIWDAVILSAAAEAGCRLLLSEDMQEGFTWGGVTVTNPFASQRHALLEVLLDGDPAR